jgi:hypothetical protein
MIDEFFDNGETGIAEANRCLNEIAATHLHGHIVKRLLNRAMGRTDRVRAKQIDSLPLCVACVRAQPPPASCWIVSQS